MIVLSFKQSTNVKAVSITRIKNTVLAIDAIDVYL